MNSRSSPIGRIRNRSRALERSSSTGMSSSGARRTPRGSARRPVEHPEGDEERVDPLLLERRPRGVEDRQQPRLQLVRWQSRLELEVGLARRDPSRRLLGLRQRPRPPGLDPRRRQESHPLALVDERLEQSRGGLADDLQPPGPRPVIQERVPQAEVEEVPPISLEPGTDGTGGIRHDVAATSPGARSARGPFLPCPLPAHRPSYPVSPGTSRRTPAKRLPGPGSQLESQRRADPWTWRRGTHSLRSPKIVSS